jgi:hypothetical protein
MAGNSNSVYGTQAPLQGTITDWLNNQEQMDFAYRDEERKIEAIAEQEKKGGGSQTKSTTSVL